MQQYRLNYRLLIGMAVGTVVASVAIYGLWRFQIERKSGALLAEAEKAQAEGDLRSAIQFYSHYMSIHGGNEELSIKLAETYADRMEQEDVAPEEVGLGLRVLEETVRTIPKAMGPQKRLVEMYGRMRRYQDALSHLELMLEKEPDNAELQSLRASYLARAGNLDEAAKYSYKLVGYDPQTDTFDEKKAAAPHDVQAYAILANILRRKDNNAELADRVMDQMIECNPDSAQAYLSRGGYHALWDEKELGKQDIEKAYRLSPKDADVLLVMTNQALEDKDYDEAKKYLDEGKKLHPDDPRFYQSAADLEARQEHYEDALKEIDAGLKMVGSQKGGILLFAKAELQFHNNDLQGVEDSIRQMKDAGFRPEYVEWFEARVLLAKEKWFEAMEALNRLRPRAVDLGNLASDVDKFLGLAYERMGRNELALRSYEEVLKHDPEDAPAKAGKQRMLAVVNPDETVDISDPRQKELNDILKQPPDEIDWPRVDVLVRELAADRKMDDFQLKLLQVNFAAMRKDFAAAKQLLKEADALKPNNLQVYRARVAVARLDPKEGPDQALKMWESVAKKFDDQPGLRLDKADILIARNDEQLRPELASLLNGIDKWTDNQKVELWAGMAQRYLGLGMPEEAQEYLSLVADKRPNELPTRMSLFALALEMDDDQGMQEAQKKILQIVRDKNDSNYLYTEARRQLSQVRRGQLGPEALPAIRQIVDRAIKQRPDWYEILLVAGDLELVSGNVPAALANYSKAHAVGRPAPRATEIYIRLLAGTGQFRKAAEMLSRLPESTRQAQLGPLYTEILFRTNKVDDAIRESRAAAEAAPNDPQKQFLYGQLLARSAQLPELNDAQRKKRSSEAIAALRKAVELEPELPDAWYAMITLNAQQDNREAAHQVLRDAQLALSGDNLQIFLAKSYEALGRWFDAETMYRAFFEMDPKNVQRAQLLAEFYAGPIYRQPDRMAKLTPLLNQIMRAAEEKGADGKPRLAANDGSLLWARRKAAELLAATRDYQNLRKAEKILASSSQDGVLSIEDRLEMAQILAARPEPESRKKAIGLLEEVRDVQPLNEAGELMLGQLYFATGDWTKCHRQMRRAISRFPNFAPARESFISMLLNRNEESSTAEAAKELDKLRKIAPNGRNTFTLTVQVASKLGKQDAVRNLLLSRLPKITDPKALNDEQVEMLAFLASLFVELKDLDTAENIYRQLAARDPKLSLSLAEFVGRYRDVGQCFQQLAEIYTPDRVNEVLAVAINTLRARRDEVGDKYDPEVERWLDRALRENADSITLLMLQADFLDVQKKYEEAADLYRKLLTRSDLEGLRRAIVLNNLSFLVALTETDAAELENALKLVQEAAQIMGPNADILDTRAVVLIGLKRYQEAIQELNLSVTDNPTGAKYFHLVVAHLGAHENHAALQNWDKALAHGLTRDSLNRLEFDRYDQVKSTIDQLRADGSSVTRSEPARQSQSLAR